MRALHAPDAPPVQAIRQFVADVVGSIVGRSAAELISVIALAVTAGLRVADLAESILVHPALAEALSEAAE